jgi:DNA uptake protein ComE-like DNA-binding protein
MDARLTSRRIALCLLFGFLSLALGFTQPKPDLVDINRAGVAELKTLPGIADAYANAIAKNRPYKNKTQLLTRGILPVTVFRKIKERIIAKQ